MSKAIRLISIFIVNWILLCSDFCKQRKSKVNTVFNDSRTESQPNPKLDLSCYVLHLEGEDALVEEHMMRSNRDATDHWFQRGKKIEPKYIMKLLEKSTLSQGFKGVANFDSEQVPSLDMEEPPNCWALPVVKLTSIALALPDINNSSIKELISGVQEGLMYINFIENYLDGKDVTNVRKTAITVWQGIDLYHKCLDVDLCKLSPKWTSSKEILEGLSETAKFIFEESRKKHMTTNVCLRDNPSKWHIRELAAFSMYRISQTILINYEGSINQTGERLFEELTAVISDIMVVCLTNLSLVISMKFLSIDIGDSEESVRHAVHILGKTEKHAEYSRP